MKKRKPKSKDQRVREARERYQRLPEAEKERRRAMVRAWNAKNPERRIVYRERWKGKRWQNKVVSREEYQKALSNQDFKCAICSNSVPATRRLHIDHCHTTGKFRGLLCSRCNHGLGMFKDSIETMGKAILYLMR